MLLPAVHYIHLHIVFASKIVKSMIIQRPRNSITRSNFGALKTMDLYSLNGGYIPAYDQLPVKDQAKLVPMANWQWYVKKPEESSGGSVRKSGGGVGRLDSANEGGFFYKLNRSRLKKLKQVLKQEGELESKPEPPVVEKDK